MARFSKKIYFASMACLFSVWVTTAQTALAQSGSYSLSYSGRLTQADGAPLSGPVDVTVKFWSAADAGNSLGAPIELTSIALNQGVFALPLELNPAQVTAVFGQGADPVFIEITAAGKTYPRQQYSYVPLALRVPVDGKTLAFDGDGKLGLSLTSQPIANQFLTKDNNGRLAWGSPVVTTLQGQNIASTAPTSGQILIYSGGQWVPQTLAVAGAAGGTVTNVTGTAPISVTTSTTTPVISMAQASGSASGYLSSADWTAFNAKPGSAVTSVSTGTGLTGGPITSSGTISLSNTSVTPGSYARANIAVDAQGRIMAAANGASVNLASEVSGMLPVGNGGTGAASFINNGILVGAGILPVSSVTGAQYQVLTASAGGTPSFGSLSLDQSAAVTGILPRANGGTGVNSTATFPSSGVIVTEGATETLTNKTLTGATIDGASSIGGLTTINTTGTAATGALTAASVSSQGNVTILGNSTTANKLVLNDKGSVNSVALKAPDALASSMTLELPSSSGSNGQVLATNGVGILSWVSAATGSVTNVTGTAPIAVANGTSTPVISMSQANGTTNGYLSSADWTTFNGKQAAGNYLTGLTGDVTAAGPGSAAAATLATVAIPGTSTKVTYDVKGRVTSGTSLEASDLPSHSAALITSGTLAVANGGTGATTLAANNVILGNGTSAVQVVAPGSSGNVLTSNGSTWTSTALPSSVTSVTGTAPISVATGTSTPVISLSQANGTTNGYLSSADWTTFNAKQSSGNYIAALTGDVTAAGPGSSAATLAAVAIAGTSTKVTYDVKGRVTSGTSLTAADIPPLNAASITSGTLAAANGGTGVNSTATFPTSGVVVTEAATETLTNKTLSDATINGASNIGGSTTINTAGTVNSGAQTVAGNVTILGNSTTANKLVLNDKGSANSVALKAPDTLVSSMTLELPSSSGSNGQVLSTNGSGTLSWVSGATGSVTNVTGTAPISVATGASTPVISMSQANGSGNGYLSSADWTTFNSKQAAGNYLTGLTGDVTASGAGSAAATLSATGVAAGTYTKVTVDAKGRATFGTSLVAADIPPLPTSIIVSGTLGVANGGTGAATITNNGVVVGAGTGALSGVTGTSSQVMTVNASNQPIFGAIDLASSAAVSSTLAVANGGTGAATLAANNVLLGNGTSALQAVAPGTSGNVLTSNGSTWTSAASVTNWAAPGTIGSTTPNTGAFTNLTTTGNVGIGTTSPTQALQLQRGWIYTPYTASATDGYQLGLGNTKGYLWRNFAGGNAHQAGYLQDTMVLSNNWYLDDNAADVIPASGSATSAILLNKGNIFMSTGAVNTVPNVKLTLQGSTGNVGIGTTAPAATLDVNGSINASGNIVAKAPAGGFTGSLLQYAGSNFIQTYYNNIDDAMYIQSVGFPNSKSVIRNAASGAALTMLANGNVGIGTTAPGSLLTVWGGVTTVLSSSATAPTAVQVGRTAADGSFSVAGASGQNSASAAQGDVILRAETTAQKLILQTGAGAAALVVNNGNVGIGTTAPTYKLHVNNNATAALTDSYGLRIDAVTGTVGASKTYGLYVNASGSDDANYAAIFASGNVGIGTTTPAGILDLVSTSAAFLPPRMTTMQRNAVVNPAAGMQVFDVTANVLMLYNGSRWQEVGAVPIGSIQAWHGSMTGVPNMPWGWVLCNGATLSDSESPLNGQIIPNLNGDGRFLRGSTTSGTVQSASNLIQHSNGTIAYYQSTSNFDAATSIGASVPYPATNTAATGFSNYPMRPVNMSVTWIMRVK